MKPPITQDLLFLYFAGRVTTFQKQLIDEWVRDTQNREVFFACLEAWENQQPQYITDPAAALERHRARLAGHVLDDRPGTPAPHALPFRWGWPFWLVAASIVVALGLGGGWLFQDFLFYRTYRTTFGEVRRVVLSDGSRVTLNANSILREPRLTWGRDDRTVRLVGEADFVVRHTADHRRFVVSTGKSLDVVVLGTEFTVYNRPHKAQVVLKTGKVQLNYQDGQTPRQLTMVPGELASLDPKGRVKTQFVQRPENYAAWRNNRFVFDQTSLQEIVRLFADTYGMTLVLPNPELAQWTVSGSFTARNGQELLETLMAAASLSYTQSNKQIIITNPTN